MLSQHNFVPLFTRLKALHKTRLNQTTQCMTRILCLQYRAFQIESIYLYVFNFIEYSIIFVVYQVFTEFLRMLVCLLSIHFCDRIFCFNQTIRLRRFLLFSLNELGSQHQRQNAIYCVLNRLFLQLSFLAESGVVMSRSCEAVT